MWKRKDELYTISINTYDRRLVVNLLQEDYEEARASCNWLIRFLIARSTKILIVYRDKNKRINATTNSINTHIKI